MPDGDKTEEVHNKVCQSCARPLIDEVRVTNEDKTPNEDYCRFCFLEGEFRNPNLTKEEAINKLDIYESAFEGLTYIKRLHICYHEEDQPCVIEEL